MSDADRTRALADWLAAAASDTATGRATEAADRDPSGAGSAGRGGGVAGESDRGGDVAGEPVHVVEVGIGERTAVAAALARRGFAVTATDVVERSVPDGIEFVRDDLTDPDPAIYRDAALVYGLRLPPELHGALAGVVRAANEPPDHEAGEASDRDGPTAAFTTLGGDPPAVPATPEQLPAGETVFWIEETDGGARP